MNNNKRQIHFLTYPEVRRLIDTIKGDVKGRRDRAIFETLFSTAMRISELLSLKRSDFDVKQLDTEKILEMTIVGKGGWQRVVYFSSLALSSLSNYLTNHESRKKWFKVTPEGEVRYAYEIKGMEEGLLKKEGFVFPFNPADDRLFPLTVRQVQKIIKRRAKEAGIVKRVTPHILRHSAATYFLDNGVDLRFVQQFLGHRDIRNTVIYTHVVNSKLKEIHSQVFNG